MSNVIQQGTIWSVKSHDERLLVGGEAGVNRHQIGCIRVLNVGVENTFEGKCDIVRRKWLAIVPKHIRAKLEGRRQAVFTDLPLGRQRRFQDRVLCVNVQKRVKQIVHHTL